MGATDLTLDDDLKLHNVLRASADDHVMRETQDRFFDEFYWPPAVRAADRLGIVSPLGTAVVYDSHVHGSWGRIRDRTTAAAGAPPGSIGERPWITAYVAARGQWLATVYRMDAFRRLIDQGLWGLELPLVLRGGKISTDTLNATPPGCYDGPEPGSRVLAPQTPLHRGQQAQRLPATGIADIALIASLTT